MSNDHAHPIFQPILAAIAPERPVEPDSTCRACGKWIRLTKHPRYACCNGRDCGCGGATLPDDICSMSCYETMEECACGSLYSPVDENGDDVDMCQTCRENAAEAAYERAQEEPCFRGGEWAAAQAAEADWIRRNLK